MPVEWLLRLWTYAWFTIQFRFLIIFFFPLYSINIFLLIGAAVAYNNEFSWIFLCSLLAFTWLLLILFLLLRRCCCFSSAIFFFLLNSFWIFNYVKLCERFEAKATLLFKKNFVEKYEQWPLIVIWNEFNGR